MKEWALKHPIMTFLLADSLIAGVLKTINAFSPRAKAEKEAPAGEDASADEQVLVKEEEE